MQRKLPNEFVHCAFCGATTSRPSKHFQKVHLEAYELCKKNNIDWKNYFSTFALPHKMVQETREHLAAKNWEYVKELGLKLMGRIVADHGVRYKQPTTYKFIWEDIFFKNKGIQIYNKRENKKFLPIEAPNSIEVLEKIKEEFFTRNHGNRLYKLRAVDNLIHLDHSPDVKDILFLIDAAVELYNFRYERKTKSRYLSEESLRHLSNEDILGIFKKEIDKGPYIKALYANHDQEFKLIPILESIGSTLEESFLFRIKRKESIYVVWENINPARATYVFKTSPNDRKLKEILVYISEQEQAKRIFLKSPQNFNWASNKLGYVGCIEHDGLSEYKRELARILR